MHSITNNAKKANSNPSCKVLIFMQCVIVRGSIYTPVSPAKHNSIDYVETNVKDNNSANPCRMSMQCPIINYE